MEYRSDRVPIYLKKFETGAGGIRTTGKITRSGVFVYRMPDGSTRREYRPDSEVFKEDSIETLKLLPLTIEHRGDEVKAENVKNLAIGKVGEIFKRDGRWLSGTVQIDATEGLEALTEGRAELSAGYKVKYLPTPGVTADGLVYDGIQTEIKYNHVTLTAVGRASEGSDRATLRLDSAVQLEESSDRAKVETVEIKINSQTFDVEAPVAEAINAERAAVQTKLDSEKARADVAEATRLDSEKAVEGLVSARVALEVEAAKILPGQSFTGKKDREVRAAVIEKLSPAMKLDGEPDEYVRSAFNILVQQRLDAVKTEAASAETTSAPTGRDAVNEARKAYNQKLQGK